MLGYIFLLTFSVYVFSQSIKEYSWEVTSFIDNPDGYSRRVLGINGEPGYDISVEGNLGDLIRVKVTNKISDPTSIHWHGIMQNGTSHMDGVTGVTQCEILPGNSYIYEFVMARVGTHWWHSHFQDQYLDGLRGAFIIRNPEDPNQHLYSAEIPILLEDWYHDNSVALARFFKDSHSTVFPRWSSGLINGRGQYACTIAETEDPVTACTAKQPSEFGFSFGKSYRLRIVNASGFSSFNFTIVGHAMSVIEADGVDLVPSALITNIFINVGQRYSVVVTADQKPGTYKMYGSMNVNTPSSAVAENQYLDTNLVYANVVYDSTPDNGNFPTHPTAYYDESMEVPLKKGVPQQASRNITFSFQFGVNPANHDTYALVSLNGATAISYKPPAVPTLFDVYYNNKSASTLPASSLAVNINNEEIIDLIVVNNDRGEHPFHLHGHYFWVIGSGRAASVSKIPTNFNLDNPPKRDTVTVNSCSSTLGPVCTGVGYAVLRFVADNPGVWFFHCHIDWHLMMGLAMTIIESEDILRSKADVAPDGCLQSVLDQLSGYNRTTRFI